MGVYTQLAERRATVINPLHPRDPALVRMFGGSDTISGVVVTDETALSSTALFAGVRFISENMASVPLKIYKRDARGKTPLRDDRRWWLLQSSPNDEQTAMELREMTIGFVVTTGNGYVEIVEGPDGIAESLWPIVPWRVRVARNPEGTLYYVVRRTDNTEVTVPAERMLHFRGFSRNGVFGVDVIDQMRESIGATLAADRAAQTFYGNGAMPSGILHTDNPLSDQAWARLKAERDKMHGGVANWHRLAILEEGLKWQQLTTDPEKSQLIETRKFQVAEVARILNLPPHVLKDLERTTFSNIEHQGLELVTYTFRAWAVRIEQVLEKRLLLPEERATHLILHNLDGFLRGDMASRYNSYAIGRTWGWLSANDVLEREDENGIGPDGDVYMAPINMLPADQFKTAGLGAKQAPPVEPDDAPDATEEENAKRQREARSARGALLRKRTEAAFAPMFQQRIQHLINRETNAVRRALKKADSLDDFTAWLTTFYEENAAFVATEIRPAFASFAATIFELASDEVGNNEQNARANPPKSPLDEWLAKYSDGYGRQESGSSRRQLADLVAKSVALDDARSAVEERLGAWDSSRASRESRREVVDLGSAVAVLAFRFAGRTLKSWYANADACPLCTSMNGRVVGIDAPFIGKGDQIEGAEGQAPLSIDRMVGHPGLHGGCDCTVVAG
jgi:HK97 family phage portal protein